MRGVPFMMPHIVGTQYAPGPQPNAPGNSHLPWAGHMGMKDVPMPWPRTVGTISALANFAGVARNRAPVPVVNQYAPSPSDYLIFQGFIGKSQG